MAIELRVVQFWSEIILVISNRTRTACSFDFEIMRMISDQIALHSVQLPLLITGNNNHNNQLCFMRVALNSHAIRSIELEFRNVDFRFKKKKTSEKNKQTFQMSSK